MAEFLSSEAGGAAAVRWDNPSFVCSVGAQTAPPYRYVVFAGRSNAGKSSVINTLCGGRYARVAKTPGRTRLINVFRMGASDSGFALADLPGYGYAVASKTEQREWGVRLARFLRTADICCVAVVVDCRRGIGELDARLFDLIAPRRLPVLVLLNKADKLKLGERRRALAEAQAVCDDVALFSALKKTGVEEARGRLAGYLVGA